MPHRSGRSRGWLSVTLGQQLLPARRNVSATDPSGVDVAGDYERAAVTLDGEVLFQVRGFPAYPAKERAKAIRKRIEAIAADQSVAVESLRVVDMEDRTRIMAGDILVAGFIDADAAADGVSRQLLAERALIKIKAAIVSYRNDRSPRVLLTNTLYALGATALMAIVLLVIRGAFRKLDGLAERRFKARIEALEAQSHQLVQARQLSKALWGFSKGFMSWRCWCSVIFISTSCLVFIRGRVRLRRDYWRFFWIHCSYGAGLDREPAGYAFVAVLVFVTRYALRLTRLYFESVDRGSVTLARFDPEWALPTYKIARLIIIAFAVVVAYPYIPGSNSEAFKGVSIFLGVVISLGSSSVIANLMAGYTMIYRRAFKAAIASVSTISPAT